MSTHLDPAYRSALVASAALNALMFAVELAIGLAISSSALIADAADMFEDACMLSLAVLAIGWAAQSRARFGLVMGCAMAGVGLTAVWQVSQLLVSGIAPDPTLMSGTAALALGVNVYCAARLVRFRKGDASVRSIWLSTRNDAILNALTIIAALFIALTSTAWPDIVAGLLIAFINLNAAREIISRAIKEMIGAAG